TLAGSCLGGSWPRSRLDPLRRRAASLGASVTASGRHRARWLSSLPSGGTEPTAGTLLREGERRPRAMSQGFLLSEPTRLGEPAIPAPGSLSCARAFLAPRGRECATHRSSEPFSLFVTMREASSRSARIWQLGGDVMRFGPNRPTRPINRSTGSHPPRSRVGPPRGRAHGDVLVLVAHGQWVCAGKQRHLHE